MRQLTLRDAPDDAPESQPGNLRAIVTDDALLLPRNAALAARGAGLRTAVDLLSFMQTFPSALAAQLHWDPDDVTRAGKMLRHQIASRLPELAATPQSRPEPAYGAINPDELPPTRDETH